MPLEGPLGGTSNVVGRTAEGASHRQGFSAGLDFPQGETTRCDYPESQGGINIRGPYEKDIPQGEKEGLEATLAIFTKTHEGVLGLRKCGHPRGTYASREC